MAPDGFDQNRLCVAWRSVEWFFDHVSGIGEECGCIGQVEYPRS